jgi:hypothetical protein
VTLAPGPRQGNFLPGDLSPARRRKAEGGRRKKLPGPQWARDRVAAHESHEPHERIPLGPRNTRKTRKRNAQSRSFRDPFALGYSFVSFVCFVRISSPPPILPCFPCVPWASFVLGSSFVSFRVIRGQIVPRLPCQAQAFDRAGRSPRNEASSPTASAARWPRFSRFDTSASLPVFQLARGSTSPTSSLPTRAGSE